MATKPTSIDAYVAALPARVQQIFEPLREVIRQLAPDAEETIRYAMPAWRVDGVTVIHAAAWKDHIGLYPVYRGNAEFELAIGPYRDKKDSVKFSYDTAIPFEIVKRIIAARLEH